VLKCRYEVNPTESVLGAMETLAREWPTGYGANAVEWLLLSELLNRDGHELAAIRAANLPR